MEGEGLKPERYKHLTVLTTRILQVTAAGLQGGEVACWFIRNGDSFYEWIETGCVGFQKS